MKKIEPSIEITIKNFEIKEWKWLKITSNTAFHNNEGSHTERLMINGNEFLKILEHHYESIVKFSKEDYSKGEDCCVKYSFNNKSFIFNFNYSEKDLLNMANILYNDFKYLIDFHKIDPIEIETCICKDIKGLPSNTYFTIDNYFKNYGIISEHAKDVISRDILEKENKEGISNFVIIKKKLGKKIYECQGVRE